MHEAKLVMKDMKGYKMGITSFNDICYGDDVVFISETKDDLQRLPYKLDNVCKQRNMVISSGKTKAMTHYCCNASEVQLY